MYVRCEECGKVFETKDRVGPTANPGAEAQVKYCSEKCKRASQNREAYQKKKEGKK